MLKDTNSLKNAIEIINDFSKMAGPKLNLGKTECLLTGSFIEIYSNDNSIHGVKINKNCVKLSYILVITIKNAMKKIGPAN